MTKNKPTAIAITGANGFIGYHLRVRLRCAQTEAARLVDRKDFKDPASLSRSIGGCRTIVHLAGMNRGADDEILATNVGCAKSIIKACEANGETPHIIFASSTHRDRDTAYGRSKKQSEELLRAWSEKSGAVVTNMVLPNVFGEFGRPFHNSVVSTFCYQLVSGQTPTIEIDSVISVVHVLEAVKIIYQAISEPVRGDLKVEGKPVRVSELLRILSEMKESYFAGIIPSTEDALAASLFNTLRSYILESTDFFPRAFELKSDARGELFEVLKHRGNEGQFFTSNTKPGMTRGNHFHTRKFERFAVTKGQAEISLRKLFSDKIFRFKVGGNSPAYIDMPTFYAHNIKNIGTNDLSALFWSNEIFNPAATDTYPENV